MSSHPSRLGRCVPAVAALFLIAGVTPGQITPPHTGTLLPRSAPSGVLQGYHVKKGTLQDLKLPPTGGRGFTVDVVLGGRHHTLLLHAHDVRAENFKLVVHDKSGLRVVPTPPNTTYRGLVRGHLDSLVAASLVDGQLEAIVQLDPEAATWGIQPVHRINQTAKKSLHLVYNNVDSNVPAGKCGVDHTAASHDAPQSTGAMAMANSLCEIGIDADYYFYVKNGSSTTATQNDVTAVMNNVATIYKRDVAIDYKITQIIVRTSVLYTTNSASSLLSQFGNYWSRNHGGVKRDVAHLFTGRNLSGGTIGVSYLSTICTTAAYGLSESRFTSNTVYRTALTAHELAHNWSSPHCSGSGCYIMCANINSIGCTKNITLFGTMAKSYIANHRNSRSCLSSATPTPVLTAVSPAYVQAFDGGTLTVSGSKLSTVLAMHVGSKVLWAPAGFKIVNDGQITLPSPVPSALLPVVVQAENAGGKSNGVPLFYTVTKPPKLTSNSPVTRGWPALWQFGSEVGHMYGFTAALSPNTVKFMGFDWLTNSLLVQTGTLSAVGYGAFIVTVPISTPIGVKVYGQTILLNPSTGSFSGTTNVTLTTIQ